MCKKYLPDNIGEPPSGLEPIKKGGCNTSFNLSFPNTIYEHNI
jgi:hypothetical protein